VSTVDNISTFFDIDVPFRKIKQTDSLNLNAHNVARPHSPLGTQLATRPERLASVSCL